MTARVLLAVALVAVAALVAWVLERRRRTGPPTQGRSIVPHQIDRADFPRPDAPWLVVLWSSRTCASCKGLAEKLLPLSSDEVAVIEVEYQEHPDLHARYKIEAAPVTIIVDADGVTQASFAGAFTATDLWAKVAELRA